MSTFSPEVVTAVCAHMNDDHTEDSLRIVQAFGAPGASTARMTGVEPAAGVWQATIDGIDTEVRVLWPAGAISERAEIRREVVALYEAACEKLGLEPSAR